MDINKEIEKNEVVKKKHYALFCLE